MDSEKWKTRKSKRRRVKSKTFNELEGDEMLSCSSKKKIKLGAKNMLDEYNKGRLDIDDIQE